MTEPTVRTGTLRDERDLVRIREEWIDEFVRAHPAPERWCPAGFPVPWIDAHRDLTLALAQRDGRGATVAEVDGRPVGYVLCEPGKEEGEVRIGGQTPRVRPGVEPGSVVPALLRSVIDDAAGDGAAKVTARFHGHPDAVGPMMDLFNDAGVESDDGRHRLEMVAWELHTVPGPCRMDVRTGADMDLDDFYEAEARVGRWQSAEESREDCDISRRMWCVDPDTDFLIAYEGGEPVGTARVAMTRSGTGMLDGMNVAEVHRGRGIGRLLLARALAALGGRTDHVWLDVDSDNVPARRLYARAGFRVIHQHGGMTAMVA